MSRLFDFASRKHPRTLLLACAVVPVLIAGPAAAGNSMIVNADGSKTQIITNGSGTIVLSFDKKGVRTGKQSLPDAGAAAHQTLLAKYSKPGSTVQHLGD